MARSIALQITLCALTLAPKGPAQVLANESKPVMIDPGEGTATTYMPEFRNGILLLRHRLSEFDTEYTTYSRDGTRLGRFRIDLPGVRSTVGGRITALRNGAGYVAVGIGVSGGERTPNLCFVGPKGEMKTVVATAPLWPARLAVAEDNTIWGFGAAAKEDRPDSDDPTVFHFSPEGALLGTAVPRKMFGPEPPFELSTELGEPQIAAAGKRVYVYDPHVRKLIELALDRTIAGVYTVELPPVSPQDSRPAALRALAPMPDGTVYARLAGRESTGIYVLDRAHGRWTPTDASVMERFRAFSMIGFDGDEIALCPAGERNGAFPVTWIRLKPATATQGQ